ncbi:MAG: hypothetical protein LBB55_00235 [Zoogloeaceae bacterium]|jgi:ABC-type transporter Mla subunit MlaD|nr:hypothetical protein [Zoogloeaceae bacterium]
MTAFFLNLWNSAGNVRVIFILLLLMALAFLFRFVLPGLLLWFDLRRASRALRGLSSPSPDTISAEVMDSPRLAHAWNEYAQTLHRQKTSNGERIRATASAGHFFSPSALVEVPLRAGFYQHLPGILTGIGIIGTFAGLIAGLSHFEVNSDTEVVRLSLRNLIQGVGHAFQISALAITLAMLFTWIEKSLLSLCGKHVASLAENLDNLFEGGVEEEYLARLVSASEHSARQTAELRKSFASEIQALLSTQQEAMTNLQAELAKNVAHAISKSLEGPLSRMAEAVERAGMSQGEATAHSLEPLLTRFMERMEGQWEKGGAGLERLLAQSAESMRRAAEDLGRAVARIEGVGQGAVNAAASGLSSAGEGVGRAAENFTAAGDTLRLVSTSLVEAANRASEVMRDSAQSRDAFAAMLSELRSLLEGARREASLTDELVGRMETAAAALGAAKTEAGEYLAGVNKVLAEAHASFAGNIERTLREGNSQFHKELALAVDYLKGAIEELGDTLENLAGNR